MSIEISTYNIAESTCNALNGKATVDEVMSVWHTVGDNTTTLKNFETVLFINYQIFSTFRNVYSNTVGDA